MNREEWLAERKTGIGSSDAAAILGLSPYKTALDVYLDKISLAPAQDESKRMRMGTLLEPVIAQMYMEATGRIAMKAAEQLSRHPSRPWQLASLDYETADRRIVECKDVEFARDGWGEPGTDEVPDHFLIQVQHQMEVTGRTVADVAALFGKHDFRVYTVRYSESFARSLTAQEEVFWRRVLERRPPEPDFRHHCTPDALALLYGTDDGVVVLGDDVLDAVNEYERLGEIRSTAESERNCAKAKILHAMQNAAAAILPDGTELRRKQVTRKEYTVKESTYQVLRVKRTKETVTT